MVRCEPSLSLRTKLSVVQAFRLYVVWNKDRRLLFVAMIFLVASLGELYMLLYATHSSISNKTSLCNRCGNKRSSRRDKFIDFYSATEALDLVILLLNAFHQSQLHR